MSKWMKYLIYILGVPVVPPVGDCYLLRDEFTTAEGPPLASPRTCEPGPGTLVLDQSDGQFSIVAPDLFRWPGQATPAWGDQEYHGLLAGGIATARKLGRVLKWRWQWGVDGESWAGWNDDTTPSTRAAAEHSIYHLADGAGIRCLSQGSDDQALYDLWPMADWSQCAIILGGYETTGLHWYPNGLDPDQYRYGAHFFFRDEAGDDSWRLAWYRQIGDDDAIYPAFSNYDSVGWMDWMRLPCDSGESGDIWTAQWPTCLTPIAWDELTDVNGTLLPAHTMTYGGLTWVNAVGVWQITGNQADPDATASAVTYVATTSPDVWVEIQETAEGSSVSFGGLTLRKSANTSGGVNHWTFIFRPANPLLDTYIQEYIDGVLTNRASADRDGSLHNMRARCNGLEITGYVDYVEAVHYGGAWVNRHATWHGLFATPDTNWRFDNFLILPRGTGLERVCYDSFSVVENLNVHVTDEGALTWIIDAGTWADNGTEADPDATANAHAHVVTTVSDVWVCGRVLNQAAYGGLLTRGSGVNNYWYYAIQNAAGTDSKLVEVNGGVQTVRSSSDTDAFAAATRYYVEIHANGQTINCYAGAGVLRETYASATFNETAVQHGLYADNNTSILFDQFRVTEDPALGEYDAAIDVF